MATVLLVGEDELLLHTRAAVLRTIGLQPVCAEASAAFSLLMDCHCDLVVFCHSLPQHVCETLAQIIRSRWPGTPLLLISAGRSWEQLEDSGIVDSVTSPAPEAFIRRTIELVGRRGVRPATSPSCSPPVTLGSAG